MISTNENNLLLNIKYHYDYVVLGIFHLLFFLFAIIITSFLFSDIISNFWFAGTTCTYCNDSWKFIENIYHPLQAPYIFHLLGTGWHYLPLYYLFLFITNNSNVSLVLSVFIIQFIFSLASLVLLHFILQQSFHLDKNISIMISITFSSILFSYYILQPSAEILFAFYQLLTWYFYIKEKYFLMFICSSFTFALRFNGAFFVLAIFFVLLIKTVNKNNLNKQYVIKLVFSGLISFIIGFSSFIFSFFVFNDFWFPLVSQSQQYSIFLGKFPFGTIGLPFLWWIPYIIQVVNNPNFSELQFFISGIISLIIGIVSIILLWKYYKEDTFHGQRDILIIYLIQFLGLNFLTSLGNFARFISFSFPFIPAIPLIFRKRYESYYIYIALILASIVFLMLNIIWLASYPTANTLF